MKMDNDNLAANDKQNVDLFAKHLSKVHNNKREWFADVAKFIRQREIAGELDNNITIKEFDRAIAKTLKWRRAGHHGGPPGGI